MGGVVEDVAIDASGQLVDGTPLNGPASLRKALLDRQDVFVASLAEKLMMYGVGRETKYYDMPTVRSVMRDAAKNRYRFSGQVFGSMAIACSARGARFGSSLRRLGSYA